MIGFTDQQERELERGARAAVDKLARAATTLADNVELGDWEQAFWADQIDILVHKTEKVAAIAVRSLDSRGERCIDVTLVSGSMLNFLSDQIVRCQVGVLNGYMPADTLEEATP